MTHLIVIWSTLFLGLHAGAAFAQCTKDTDCRGTRICESGKCIYDDAATDADGDSNSSAKSSSSRSSEFSTSPAPSTSPSSSPSSSTPGPPAAPTAPAGATTSTSPAEPGASSSPSTSSSSSRDRSPTKTCFTSYGNCPMTKAVRKGTSCSCQTPVGPIGGVAR